MVAEVHANAADTALGCQRDRGARVTRGGPGDPFWPPPSPPRGTEGLATRGTGTRVAWALRPRPDAPWHRRPPAALGARGEGDPSPKSVPTSVLPQSSPAASWGPPGTTSGTQGGDKPTPGDKQGHPARWGGAGHPWEPGRAPVGAPLQGPRCEEPRFAPPRPLPALARARCQPGIYIL